MFGAPSGSYVCVRFSDNGVGMSAEVRDRAFEPFFTTKPRGEGSGLGLATVYGIVLQSGGFTKIYSDEGVGTCITILLPVDPHSDESRTERGDRRAFRDAGRIGDDPRRGRRRRSCAKSTRRILSRSGYTVLTASSGLEAIEIAANSSGANRPVVDRRHHGRRCKVPRSPKKWSFATRRPGALHVGSCPARARGRGRAGDGFPVGREALRPKDVARSMCALALDVVSGEKSRHDFITWSSSMTDQRPSPWSSSMTTR